MKHIQSPNQRELQQALSIFTFQRMWGVQHKNFTTDENEKLILQNNAEKE